MAKLKKSEAFTVEREKEIQQVSKICICNVILTLCCLLMDSQFLSCAFLGCRICERACSDYEGFISTSHRPGQQILSLC